MTTSCTYDNPGNITVTSGENPATEEECLGIAAFFPAPAGDPSLLCLNGSVF